MFVYTASSAVAFACHVSLHGNRWRSLEDMHGHKLCSLARTPDWVFDLPEKVSGTYAALHSNSKRLWFLNLGGC